MMTSMTITRKTKIERAVLRSTERISFSSENSEISLKTRKTLSTLMSLITTSGAASG